MARDLFNRDITTTENERGVHGTTQESLSDSAPFSVHTFTLQGDYNELKALRDGHYCNEVVTDSDTFLSDFNSCKGDKVIVGMNLTRSVGMRGELSVTVKLFQRGYEGGIDFETISKDIIYWRQLCKNSVPDLSKISLWMQMKNDQATIPLYYAYKYLDENGETKEIKEYDDKPTYKLAGMIMRGVESFSEYVPTLTITYNLAAHPLVLGVSNFSAGRLLGKVVEANEITLDGQGFSICLGTNSGGISPVEDFVGMYEGKILCTADQIRINSDGSCTLTRAFTKFRQIEPELYIGAGGELGPYDENN